MASTAQPIRTPDPDEESVDEEAAVEAVRALLGPLDTGGWAAVLADLPEPASP